MDDPSRHAPEPDETSPDQVLQPEAALRAGLEQQLLQDEVRAQNVANEIILAHEHAHPEAARKFHPLRDVGRASLVEEILKIRDPQHPTEPQYWAAHQLVALLQDTSTFPLEPDE